VTINLLVQDNTEEGIVDVDVAVALNEARCRAHRPKIPSEWGRCVQNRGGCERYFYVKRLSLALSGASVLYET
jgi:hypothetical protein